MRGVHRSEVVILVSMHMVVLAGFAPAQEQGLAATVRINRREEKAPVPAGIDGIFMEEISLVLGRDKAEMYLDGEKISDTKAEPMPAFFATGGYDRKGKAVVLKATNCHAQPVRADIQLDGAAKVGQAGRHLVIRSAGQYDENTLDNPRRIVPQDVPLPGCARMFSVTLPPYSVNVLRIPAE